MQVGKHEVIVCFGQQVYGLISTRSRIHDVAFVFKDSGGRDAKALFVVDDQQASSLRKRNKSTAGIIQRCAISRLIKRLTHLVAKILNREVLPELGIQPGARY